MANVAHQIAPDLTEKLMGHQTHKALMEDAPPAPKTAGSVAEPMPSGTGVSGGDREK